MDINTLTRLSETQWQVEPTGAMRVPAILFGSEALIRDLDD